MTDFSELLARFPQQTILVVGDVMLDHFVIGSVERISPEAPVPIVRFARDEYRLGGAANVAANLRALGACVEIVGLTGRDVEGTRLREELERIGVSTSGLVADPARCTGDDRRSAGERVGADQAAGRCAGAAPCRWKVMPSSSSGPRRISATSRR